MSAHPDLRPSSNLPILFEIGESIIRDRIFELQITDFIAPIEDLISSILPDLLLVPPHIDWDNGQFKFEYVPTVNADSHWWRLQLLFPFDDPTDILTYVDWLPDRDGDFYPNQATGQLMLAERIACETCAEAMFQFDASIQSYKADLSRVWIEAERFNDAVPYMISRWADVRKQHLRLNRPMPNYGSSRLNGLRMRFGTDSAHVMEIKTTMRKTKNDN
jgi:hypothetical protein